MGKKLIYFLCFGIVLLLCAHGEQNCAADWDRSNPDTFDIVDGAIVETWSSENSQNEWNNTDEQHLDSQYNYDEKSELPVAEDYQEIIATTYNLDIPEFEKYGLDLHTTDKDASVETIKYCSGGFDGERNVSLPEYKSYADVAVWWATFYDETLGITSTNVTGRNIYAPKMEKACGIAFNEKQMEAVETIETIAGEGYEWRGIFFDSYFYSYTHGYSSRYVITDYYDVIGSNQSTETIRVNDEVSFYKWESKQKDNEIVTVYCLAGVEGDGKGQAKAYYFCYVPKDYDGCVAGIYDSRLAPNGLTEGTNVFDYMNENMHLFRLK